MPIYLIKNNLKLMLRNKWLIFVMVVGPIIIIAMLTSAFEDMMKSYEDVEEFTVGYRLEEESVFYDYIAEIKEAGKETGILFTEISYGSPEEVIEQNNVECFVEFAKEAFTIYRREEHKIEGIKIEYFLNQVVMSAINDSSLEHDESINVPVVQLKSMPDIEAKDYYGIIEIVYFIWCGFVSLASVLSGEKKYGIEKRLQVSPVSDFGVYMAKVIPGILATICEMIVTIFLVNCLYDIRWGNIPYTILVLCLTVVAATTLGLFALYLFQDLALTIITTFTLIFFWGFFGGSFETYMFSSWSETVKNSSPIYHINRTLVEYSSMGRSDYTGSCILYLIVISIICTVAGLSVAKLRKVRMS